MSCARRIGFGSVPRTRRPCDVASCRAESSTALVEPAHQDQPCLTASSGKPTHQLDAVDPRHPEIQHHHVEEVVVQAIELVRTGCGNDVVARPAGELHHQFHDLGLVVDHEQSRPA